MARPLKKFTHIHIFFLRGGGGWLISLSHKLWKEAGTQNKRGGGSVPEGLKYILLPPEWIFQPYPFRPAQISPTEGIQG